MSQAKSASDSLVEQAPTWETIVEQLGLPPAVAAIVCGKLTELGYSPHLPEVLLTAETDPCQTHLRTQLPQGAFVTLLHFLRKKLSPAPPSGPASGKKKGRGGYKYVPSSRADVRKYIGEELRRITEPASGRPRSFFDYSESDKTDFARRVMARSPDTYPDITSALTEISSRNNVVQTTYRRQLSQSQRDGGSTKDSTKEEDNDEQADGEGMAKDEDADQDQITNDEAQLSDASENESRSRAPQARHSSSSSLSRSNRKRKDSSADDEPLRAKKLKKPSGQRDESRSRVRLASTSRRVPFATSDRVPVLCILYSR